jgi:hypothetical protein
MSNQENIVTKLEETQNEKLTELFEEYKKSDDYQYYFELIKQDKPMLSIYLINIILYGYFYENYISELPEIERKKYVSILEREQKTIPPVKGDMKGITIYDNEDDYKKQHPNVKPIKTIGEPLTLIETNENTKNEII